MSEANWPASGGSARIAKNVSNKYFSPTLMSHKQAISEQSRKVDLVNCAVMKHKPQISFGPSMAGIMRWTIKESRKDARPITEAQAREHWDNRTADWSIPAWQEMSRVVMLEAQEIEVGVER
jgi:hypothetical protein